MKQNMYNEKNYIWNNKEGKHTRNIEQNYFKRQTNVEFYFILLQGCEIASWKKNHALAPTRNNHKGRKWGKCQPQKEGKHHE